MKRLTLTLLLVPSLVAATPALTPESFVRDPNHSQSNFTADSRLVSAPGTFDRWDAAIRFDAETGMGCVTGNVVIDRCDVGVGFNPPMNPIEAEVPVQVDVTFKKA